MVSFVRKDTYVNSNYPFFFKMWYNKINLNKTNINQKEGKFKCLKPMEISYSRVVRS